MRSHLSIMALALSAGLLSAAPAPEDAEKIQGTWKIESLVIGGTERVDAKRQSQLIFAGEKFKVKDGDDTTGEGSFKLDPATKPKNIDLQGDGRVAHGIYKFDGDTLTICGDESGKPRPTEFESKKGSEVNLYVLKRIKP
jgi:uncharacterized protein (TIGR03067 family)